MRVCYSDSEYATYAAGACGYIIRGLPRCQGRREKGSAYCPLHNKVRAREQRLLAEIKERAPASMRIWPGQKLTHIYFVRGPDGPVKIGKADSITKRLASLQTGSAVELSVVANFLAPPKVEKQLHTALAGHHLRGEWFRWCSEIEFLLALVAEHKLDVVRRFCDSPGLDLTAGLTG